MSTDTTIGDDTAASAGNPSRYSQRKLPDGTTVVTSNMRLPAGWSQHQVTVEFVLPIPFPSAQPDCFYVDADLRLANGAMPTNTGPQVLDGQPRLWFSWHLTSWSPDVDNITTYLRFIESRFRDAR
jgi:hypothetical protein